MQHEAKSLQHAYCICTSGQTSVRETGVKKKAPTVGDSEE